eukprot:scaffold2062_cov162-Cylindrotheca_fusiformis.AAC.1
MALVPKMKHRLLWIHLSAAYLALVLDFWNYPLMFNLEFWNVEQYSHSSPTIIVDHKNDIGTPEKPYPFEFAGCLVTRDDK